MTNAFRHLRAVVFDWAGTTVDFGSCAPATVFREIFRREGVEITAAQAREPMGLAKREHIATITRMPDVAARWQEKFGEPPGEADVDRMYTHFLPLQKEVLSEHSELIGATAEVVASCRERGLRIGSSTGYTRELMEIVAPLASSQGYAPDCIVCSDDVEAGRPAPWMLLSAAQQMDVYPMSAIVKVDDTGVGIEAGRNAGAWTIGISRAGNAVGLSISEFNALDDAEQRTRIDVARELMLSAGAHAVIESLDDLMPILEQFDAAASDGQRP